MTLIPVDSILSSSADPVVILTSGSKVAWSNQAFDALAARIAPDPIIPPEIMALLAKTSHFATYELAVPVARRGLLKLTAVAMDISSGDPDSVAVLVTLKATDSDQSRLVMKEELLAAVAHDLRNPLGAIFAYADALLDTPAGEGLSSSQREILRRIRSTSSRSVDLILNYQLLARLQSKGFLRPSVPLDLNEAIRGVIEHTWREDSPTPILDTNLSTELLPVYLERVQVERALGNVISNALKYTPAGGKITIKSEAQQKYFVVSVHNTGTHIPEYELPGVFERYKRASSSQGKGGSGLGLYIVRTILDAAGGKVEAKSTPEEGVTFSLYFPKK